MRLFKLKSGLIQLYIAVLLLSLFSNSIHANTSTTQQNQNHSARINGVADFLLERAQDTALYLYEQSIRDNKNLQCYFPTTYDTLNSYQQGTLKIFISSKAQWQNAIRNDMETLLVRSFAKEIEANVNFGNKQVPIANTVIGIMQQLDIRYTTTTGATAYSPLTVTMFDADPESRKKMQAFYQPFEELLASLAVFKAYTPSETGSICNLPRFNYHQFTQEINGLTALPDTLKTWLEHVKKHQADLRPSTQLLTKFPTESKAWQAVCEKAKTHSPQACNSRESFIQQLITKFSLQSGFDAQAYLVNDMAVLPDSGDIETLLADYKALISPIKKLYDSVKAVQSNAKNNQQSTSELAQQALALIKKWWKVQHPNDTENQDLWKLSKHIQFFALLSDANTADEVKGILSTFALPATGFWQKRTPEPHLMVTSYFGAAYNMKSNVLPGSESNNHNNGFYVPIGLEYTFDRDLLGLSEGALSIMLAPFDFGYPINLKLNGIEQDFEVDEIFAPSLAVSYGLQKWPLVVGVAYQKGAKFDEQASSESRMLLFVAFDMPLFNLM